MKRIRQKTRKNKGFLGRLINRIRGGKNDNKQPVDPAQYGGMLDEVEVISKAKGPSKLSFNPLKSIGRIVKNKISENVVPYGYNNAVDRVLDAIKNDQEGNAFGSGSDQMGIHERDIRMATAFDEAETMKDFFTQLDAERGLPGQFSEGYYYDNYTDKESELPPFLYKALGSRERQQLFNAMLGQSGNKYKGETIGGYEQSSGLRPSQYRPSNAKDSDAKYVSSPVEERTLMDDIGAGVYRKITDIPTNENIEKARNEFIKQGDSKKVADKKANALRRYGYTAGNMTLSLGEDENGTYISYYDVWDLDPFQGKNKFMDTLADGAQNLLGVQPQELYGRLYYTSDNEGNITSIYDPITGETLRTFDTSVKTSSPPQEAPHWVGKKQTITPKQFAPITPITPIINKVP